MKIAHAATFTVLAASFASVGCIHGSYRVVKRTPNSGELALMGPQDEARFRATEYMASQCPAGYDIVEEGEAVIGQEGVAQTQRGVGFFGPTLNTQTSTVNKTEWRVKFQCKETAGAKAAPHAKIQEFVVRY